jgi:hypothetical protein
MVMRRSILCNAFSLGRNHRRSFQQQQQQQQQTREKSWKRNSLKTASSLAAFGSRGEGSRSGGGDTMGSIISEKEKEEKKEEKKDDGEDEEVVVCYEHGGKNTGDARKLEAWLTQHGINVRETFSPSSSSSFHSASKNENEDTQNGLKSIDDLLKEIENGETVLTEHETTHDDGTVKLSCIRRVSVVVVEITSKSKPNKKLVEYEQTLPSGLARKRERFLSEKIMSGKGETPLEAAKRGIREELGDALSPNAVINIDETSLRSLPLSSKPSFSQSYKALPTRYRFYEVNCEIDGLAKDMDEFTSTEACGTKAVWKWV